jgi:hypothetical protein
MSSRIYAPCQEAVCIFGGVLGLRDSELGVTGHFWLARRGEKIFRPDEGRHRVISLVIRAEVTRRKGIRNGRGDCAAQNGRPRGPGEHQAAN